jgi:glutathione S-transferase
MNTPGYTLYIGNKNYSTWSLRPWVLMQELGITFAERLVPFTGGSNWESFRNFSPSGKVPCLVDGNTTVWDSLAIMEYLAERHATVWPEDRAARAWARSAAAEMHSGFTALRTYCPMNCGIRVQLRETLPAVRTDLARIEELWMEGLDRHGGEFLAGERFTAVDAFYAPVAFRLQTYDLEMTPEALDYAARLRALPAMKGWLEGALAEPWREPAHEQEARDVGTIVEDRRRSL